jgi:hypothetical protein
MANSSAPLPVNLCTLYIRSRPPKASSRKRARVESTKFMESRVIARKAEDLAITVNTELSEVEPCATQMTMLAMHTITMASDPNDLSCSRLKARNGS